MQDLSDISTGLLHPFQECPTHINYFSFYNLNYESLLDVVLKTTNHMLFILSNNIKISSHGLINNLISNGSHTIIFHIIKKFMLTHQLACINISFSNTHFKPFNSTIIVLPFTPHSCSSCQATTYKQFHMDHFGPIKIRIVFNSPNVTPRPERVYGTCNCRGTYVHQVSL